MIRLLLIFLLLPAVAAAEPDTVYTGEQTLFRETVWEGEVLVDGILTVAPGATLEIRPGTVVRFTRFDSNGDGIGEHEIFIQGILQVDGTEASPVLFTSAEAQPRPGDWGALNMMVSGEGNRLEHTTVEYAYRGFHAHFSRGELVDSTFRRNVRGIQFQESTVTISGCRVVDNRNGLQFRDSDVVLRDSQVVGNYWGLRCVYSEVAMTGCRIADNRVNGANLRDSTVRLRANTLADNRRGLYLQRSRGRVEANRIGGNSEHGILLEDSDCQVVGNRVVGNGRAGVKWIDSVGALRQNDLAGNGEFALINDGEGPVDARSNWWGELAPQAVAALVRDGGDRTGLGRVDASAPLQKSPELHLLPVGEP